MAKIKISEAFDIGDVADTDVIPIGRPGNSTAFYARVSRFRKGITGDVDGGTASTVYESYDEIDGGSA